MSWVAEVAVTLICFLSLLRNLVEGKEFVYTDTKQNIYHAVKSSILHRQHATDTWGVGQSMQIGFLANLLMPEIERSECSAWDSCVLRCGDPILGAPYLCSCDANCVKYNDCCVDHTFYCGAPNVNTTTAGRSIHSKTYECRKWLQNNYYGMWYVNGMYSGRKCLRNVPPWCDPKLKPMFTWDYTQSLSILLNFGPDGWNNDLLFSSDFYDPHRCPNNWEIWDPFTEICRPIECHEDFELDDGKCVWDGEGTQPSAPELLRFASKEASISFHGNILMDDLWAPLAMPLMRLDMTTSLAKKTRVGSDRFTRATVQKDETPSRSPVVELPGFNSTEEGNFTIPDADDWHLWVLTEDGFPVTVNFTMRRRGVNDTDELTIEQFLSVLHEAVALRGVLRTITNVPMKINSVEKHLQKEEIDFFQNWCKGGDLKSYWNEAFEALFVLKEPVDEESSPELELAVKIKETNKTYYQGHYVANMLFQSTDLDADTANLSGVVIVCENRPQIMDSSCIRVTLNLTDFVINDDNSLTYEGELPGIKEELGRTEYEYTEDGNIRVCLDLDALKSDQQWELSTAEQIASFLTLVLLSLSLICLAFTILTYCLFSELRTLPGWCVLNFSVSKFIFFLLFIAGARPSTSEDDVACTVIAVLLHMFALMFFSWSSVISYDLLMTFTRFVAVMRSKEKYLTRYSLIGCGIPIAIVFVCVMIDFHSDIGIDYGKNVCWIGNSMAALYVFALPIACSIIINVVFFILTVNGIRRVSKQVSSRIQGDKRRFVLFVRMSSVQCFAWVFGFLAVLTHFSDVVSRIFEFFFLILSAMQGIYIFAAFICNERVRRLYQFLRSGKYDWRRQMTLGENSGMSSIRPVTATTKKKENLKRSTMMPVERKLSGNRNVMAGRTNSNETCISFVST